MIVQPMVLTKLRPMLPPLGAAVDVNVDLTVEFAVKVVVGFVAKAAVGFAAAETAVGLASELAGFAVGSADVGCCEVSCGLQVDWLHSRPGQQGSTGTTCLWGTKKHEQFFYIMFFVLHSRKHFIFAGKCNIKQKIVFKNQ